MTAKQSQPPCMAVTTYDLGWSDIHNGDLATTDDVRLVIFLFIRRQIDQEMCFSADSKETTADINHMAMVNCYHTKLVCTRTCLSMLYTPMAADLSTLLQNSCFENHPCSSV